MAAPKKKSIHVRLEELCFYFDGVERDRMDSSGTSRKSAEILALRDRLLKLPDENFDAAIKTVKSLVDDVNTKDGDDARATRGAKGKALYDQVRGQGRGGTGGGTSKVSPA